MPNWCILNGLITESINNELDILNLFERQLIQRAKVFQTIIRLETYTGKVPTYNALKAVKGTMFVLPLLMDNTLVDLSAENMSFLHDPEMYILVEGRPTKKVVWQSLGQTKLKMCFWFSCLVIFCQMITHRQTDTNPQTQKDVP